MPSSESSSLPGAGGTHTDRPLLAHRRLHVLHVTGASSGDAAVQTLDYLRDQVDRGWTVTVACPSRGPLGFEARELGARVTWWSPPAVTGVIAEPWLAARRLRRALRGVHPDVAHLHGARAGLVGRLVLRNRVPTVYQPHGHGISGVSGHLSRPAADCERWAARVTARWTAQLLCVRSAERDRAEALGMRPVGRGVDGDSAVAMLGAGVDVTRWRAQGPQDRSAARTQLRQGDGPLAVCAGRFSASVRPDELVEAWDQVRGRVPNARLALVGDGPGQNRLGELIRGRTGIELIGARSDLATWYAAADVVVVPARPTSAPLTALQAMASARSVVVTGDLEATEFLGSDTGAVVADGDTSAVVAAVVRRLGNLALAEEEGWRGRRHVEQHHDCADVARELARIYPRLVAARRA